MAGEGPTSEPVISASSIPPNNQVSLLEPLSSMPVNRSLSNSRTASPSRSSSRKPSLTSARPQLPTPLSMSPKSSFQAVGLPPSFTTSSRYPASHHTPYSPYRPGEYGRSERGLASERTRIERKLFDDDDLPLRGGPLDDDKTVGRVKDGSSPLAPAFEAKMVLRNGASVDLISWLRTNFHHIPEQQHNSMTPSMSLIGIRALLLERFPRVPDLTELSKAVLAAFPHSKWIASQGAFQNTEPPMLRGLVWHGKDVADEDEDEDQILEEKEKVRPHPQIITRARASGKGKMPSGSRSPTQSTLVSPISSSARKALPDTPARSVLEEFAEIATLADKTPVSKARSLPGDSMIPSPAYALANICNSFGDEEGMSRKRRASQSPETPRRRASTPDKLHGLLAAAEAVEGSPITSVLGHKRRRTIGGPGTMRDVLSQNRGRKLHSRMTVSPAIGGRSFLPGVTEFDGEFTTDLLVPLNDTASAVSLTDLETVSMATHSRQQPRGTSSSSASQASNISTNVPARAETSGGRRANELPTQGDHPGVDCKPPYPYHEMIRHAIEEASDRRLQLSQIYSSIADRFPFFKTLDEKKTAGWQNSIRHNLSLKKMFVRVNKPDGIPDDSGGKGGWWTVQLGVPDEGRPGRKSKGKGGRPRTSGEAVESICGDNETESVNGSIIEDRKYPIEENNNGVQNVVTGEKTAFGAHEMGMGVIGLSMDWSLGR